MSISFSSIKGYHNKVNLGDSGYNVNEKFNKNGMYTGGNPTNWNSNHNIIKDKSKSIHTRYKEKVGSEVISNMNRDAKSFNEVIDFSKSLGKIIVLTRGEKGAVAIRGNEVVECGVKEGLKIIMYLLT